MIPRLTVTRVLRRAQEGAHKPPVILASDGHEYVLKLFDRDPDFPACELVAAMLAPAFGVDTPPFALVDSTPEIRLVLSFTTEYPDLITGLDRGPVFASRWLPGAVPWTPEYARSLGDARAPIRLFAFDLYTENGDRQPSNPNVLLVDGRRLVAIDHGQALPCVQGAGDGPYTHAAHVAWPLVAAEPSALVTVADVMPREEAIDAAVDCVPGSWWADSRRPDAVRRALRARRDRARAILRGLSTR